MTAQPLVLLNASASQVADVISDHYGVPADLVVQFADRLLAEVAAEVADDVVADVGQAVTEALADLEKPPGEREKVSVVSKVETAVYVALKVCWERS